MIQYDPPGSSDSLLEDREGEWKDLKHRREEGGGRGVEVEREGAHKTQSTAIYTTSKEAISAGNLVEWLQNSNLAG